MFKYLVALACLLIGACLVNAVTTPLTTRVYIGGAFNKLNGTTYNNIAYYDLKESALKQMENGTDGTVNVVHTDIFGNVYIGGSFTQVAAIKTGPVAMWNIYLAKWISVELSSPNFAGVVTAIDTDCKNVPGSTSISGLFPCDIYIGGQFKITTPAISNLAWYNYDKKTWANLGTNTVASVSVIAKNELQLTTSSKVYVGADFTKLDGVKSSFGIYDTSAGTWSYIDGVTNVNDIYYNPNIFSTDNIFIAASTFTETTCKGVCNYNYKKGTWSAEGAVATGSVKKIRYIKGLSSSNVGSIFVSGTGMTSSNIKRRDGTGDYAVIGAGYPTSTVNAMDICGLFSQETVTGCKSGSVAVGGSNFLQFFDASTTTWKDLLPNAFESYTINSIYVKTSSAIRTSISFVVMALVACVLALF